MEKKVMYRTEDRAAGTVCSERLRRRGGNRRVRRFIDDLFKFPERERDQSMDTVMESDLMLA